MVSGGDIAGLIAASAFLLLVIFLAVPLIKLGKVLDETRLSLHDVTKDVSPLIKEARDTLATANRELDKFDGVTSTLAKVAENVAGIVALVTGVVNSPLAKIAGVVGAFGSGRRGKTTTKQKKRKG